MNEDVPAKRDGFAVASLITGVLGFFGVTAVLGVGFGIAALVRLHRTGGRGRGLAIGGIAAGVVWAIALPIAVFVLVAGLLSASNAPIAALEIDNCYNKARPGRDAVRVTCAGEHDGLVLDAFTMASPNTPYPGEKQAAAAVERSCQDRLDTLFHGEDAVELPPEVVVVGYAPDEKAWAEGKRNATCGMQRRSGRIPGS